MAKLDALAEKFYKLIHKLTGDTVSDASAVAGMSINEVCDKLQEEIGNGDLDLVDELAELADVALATPANGQVLTYDGTAEKWKNADASGGGGSFVVTITEDSGTYSADKTLAEINAAYATGIIPVALITITSLDESTYDLAMALQACNGTIATFGALYWSADLSTLNHGSVTVSSEGVVDFYEVSLTIS